MRRALGLIVALLWSLGAQAQPALIPSSVGVCVDASGTNHTCSYGANLSAGALLFAAAEDVSGGTVTGISDSVNGSYTAILNSFASNIVTTNGRKLACGYFPNNASTGTPVVTSVSSGSGNSVNQVIAAYTGVKTSSPLIDSKSGSLSSGTTQTGANTTATAANQLLIGVVITDMSNPSDITAHSSETERGQNATRLQLEDKLTSGSGTISTSWTFVTTADAAAYCEALFDVLAASPPTFSVSPAIGTRTTSTIPITATTACTDCSTGPAGFYGVEYTDGGSTPTCTQIKAGQDSSGSAAFKAFGPIAMTTTVQNTGTFSSITDGTKRDSAYCLNSTSGGDSSVSTLGDIDKLPAFTTPLTVASTSTSAFTSNSKLLDGPGTVTWVRCKYGATPPSVSQVEAHSGGCITDYATDDASGTMALTVAGGQPDGDLFYVGQYSFGGQHEASVHTLSGQCLSAGTGFQLINCPTGLTSLGTGSPPKLFNDKTIVTLTYGTQTANFTVGGIVLGGTSGAYGQALLDSDAGVTGQLTLDTLSGAFQSGETLIDNFGGVAVSTGAPSNYADIATGDVLQVPTTVQPSGAALTVGVDGQYSYSAAGRQTALNGLIFDASADSYMTLDADFVSTNTAPSCAPVSVLLTTNVAMSAINLNDNCSDVDNDPISWARIINALPAGLVYSATTGLVSGTPTVQDLVGVTITFLAYDGYGGTTTKQITLKVATNFTLTDCTSTPTLALACASSITTLTSGSVLVTSSYVCNATVAADYVISQNPAAGATVTPGDSVALSVSLGTANSACVAHFKTASCLRKTLTQCETIYLATPFNGALSVIGTASCPSSAYQHDDLIYAQTPAPGAVVNSFSTINVSYCPSP